LDHLFGCHPVKGTGHCHHQRRIPSWKNWIQIRGHCNGNPLINHFLAGGNFFIARKKLAPGRRTATTPLSAIFFIPVALTYRDDLLKSHLLRLQAQLLCRSQLIGMDLRFQTVSFPCLKNFLRFLPRKCFSSQKTSQNSASFCSAILGIISSITRST